MPTELTEAQERKLFEKIDADIRQERVLAENFLRRPSSPYEFQVLRAGIEHAFHNAEALVSDAQLLAQHRRASRCFTLSHCAIEEVGKMAVLHAMTEIPLQNQKMWAYAWKHEFRSHRAKYSLGRANLWTDLLYEQLGAHFSYDDMGATVSERFRQLGLYIEYLAFDDRWGTPEEITLEMAEAELGHARAALARATYYVDRNLYAIEHLTLRRDICGKIYPKADLPPSLGEEGIRWRLSLLAARQKFFQELVRREVLLPMYGLNSPVAATPAADT